MTPEQEALLKEADEFVEYWDEADQTPPKLVTFLARELRAALADAERYRYLRSWKGQWIVVREEPEDTQLHGDVLDAAIDAAREKGS